MCVGDLEVPLKNKNMPKIEKPKILNINVFDLTRTVLTSVHFFTNYDQPQIDWLFLFLYEKHFCLITKLHTVIYEDSLMKHV